MSNNLIVSTGDDLLWVAKPTIRDVYSIIFDPCYWVYQNVQFLYKESQVNAITMPNYAMSFQATGDPVLFGTDSIYLQGIHLTNVLTLRIPTLVAQDYLAGVLAAPPQPPDPDYAEENPPSAQELAYLAELWIYNSGATDIDSIVTNLFGKRQIQTTIGDKKKAYVHMPLSPTTPLTLIDKQLGTNYALTQQQTNRIASAVFHIAAAAKRSSVECSFNGCDMNGSSLQWKVWNSDESVWSDDPSPGYLARRPFQSMNGDNPPPMTITGLGTDYYYKSHKPKDGLIDVASPDNEQICEVLVAEYTANDQMVTWCEAFSKTYGG